jgi:penicillin V acylase-like amidase (Ntn superfamily)
MSRLSRLLLLLLPANVLSCTAVNIKTSDGITISARTMEMGIPRSDSELEAIYIHPRGTPTATVRGTLNSSKWGFLAVQFSLDEKTLPFSVGTTEGINEKGLTVSVLTYNAASYEQPNPNKSVAIFDLQASAYMLGCCASVEEATEALRAVNVVPTPVVGIAGRVHWHVQDRSGASRALEYVDGELRSYDNTQVGVLTNDPGYEWQLGYLNQFASYPSGALTPKFQYTVESRGPFSSSSVPVDVGHAHEAESTTTVPVSPSHGLNMRMLPASWSPPDRFVRMFLMRQAAVAHAPPKDLDAGIALATGLLNTVHIVRGAVTGAELPLEYTNWCALKVPSGNNGTAAFYYRTYANMQWKRIDLGRLDFTPGTKYPAIQLYEPGLGIRDATPSHPGV